MNKEENLHRLIRLDKISNILYHLFVNVDIVFITYILH